MKRESERQYVSGSHDVDSSKRWESETGYMTGLGEDGGNLVDHTITPSGHATRQTLGDWTDVFKEAVPAVAALYQQQSLNKMNIELINRNKPPLTAEQYTQTYQPAAAKVQVGPTDDAKRWIMYGGAALLVLVGLRAAKVI